jgi:hypothetical protein
MKAENLGIAEVPDHTSLVRTAEPVGGVEEELQVAPRGDSKSSSTSQAPPVGSKDVESLSERRGLLAALEHMSIVDSFSYWMLAVVCSE